MWPLSKGQVYSGSRPWFWQVHWSNAFSNSRFLKRWNIWTRTSCVERWSLTEHYPHTFPIAHMLDGILIIVTPMTLSNLLWPHLVCVCCHWSDLINEPIETRKCLPLACMSLLLGPNKDSLEYMYYNLSQSIRRKQLFNVLPVWCDVGWPRSILVAAKLLYQWMFEACTGFCWIL